jgi:hypothetical protein
MSVDQKLSLRSEWLILSTAVLALVVSAVIIGLQLADGGKRMAGQVWLSNGGDTPVVEKDFAALAQLRDELLNPLLHKTAGNVLFSSELRVAAIGSAYPIPYDAEVCPFSEIPQPSMNQLDRDGDGITDDWELEFNLDKYNVKDAGFDPDADGFTNLEEFNYTTNPLDAASHPPYALKLRFVERKDMPFPFTFQGASTLPDDRLVFQLNEPATGKSHFVTVGEDVKEVVVQRFVKGDGGKPDRLVVMRGSTEITLPKGEIVSDPESQAELINILDRSPEIVTMGALLSLHNDTYTVLGVYPDRVVIKHVETGNVFDIEGLAEDER